MIKAAIAAAALTLAALPAFADRIKAEAECDPSENALQFNCMITLTEAGSPVQPAVFTVKPEMPSMPMVHNISPIPALEGCGEGIYHVVLKVEMYGDWMLRLDMTEPRRDVVMVDVALNPAEGEMPAMAHTH